MRRRFCTTVNQYHVVYTGDLEPLAAEVRDEGNSDHLPIVAVFVKARNWPALVDRRRR